jgi:hypothetical protein
MVRVDSSLENADKCCVCLKQSVRKEKEPEWEETHIWNTQVALANCGKMRKYERIKGSKETFQISTTLR